MLEIDQNIRSIVKSLIILAYCLNINFFIPEID